MYFLNNSKEMVDFFLKLSLRFSASTSSMCLSYLGGVVSRLMLKHYLIFYLLIKNSSIGIAKFSKKKARAAYHVEKMKTVKKWRLHTTPKTESLGRIEFCENIAKFEK